MLSQLNGLAIKSMKKISLKFKKFKKQGGVNYVMGFSF